MTSHTPTHFHNGDFQELKTSISGETALLTEIAQALHDNPEIRFQEKFACKTLSAALESHGFDVEVGVGGLETAFVGTWSSGDTHADKVTVAVFCEYDALEEIGHACGHNIIATAGLGAGFAIKQYFAARTDLSTGIVLKVIGSPGEEGGAGKVPLINAGLLDDVDFALMVHPAGQDDLGGASMARVALDIDFHGKASHAAAAPEEGVNALDAATLSLTAIGLLRQQVRGDIRIHAIITNGGQAPNIIPERTSVRAFIRGFDQTYLLESVVPRVENCFNGAALATGCRVEINQITPPYLSMNPNPTMSALAEQNFKRLGRTIERGQQMSGSTDMANVSHVVPSIHPMICLEPDAIPHTREFAAAANGEQMQQTIVDGALLLAATAVELVLTPELLAKAKAEFNSTKQG